MITIKNIAIITGASSGLGREFVKLISKSKNIDEIWALSRNKKKLSRLKIQFGKKIKIFPIDLSDINAINKFSQNLSNVNIKILINNAGYAKFCSYNDISIYESANMINLNCSAVVAMCVICIPHMKNKSHIINISSQAAFQPLPYQNIYSSTKAFVKNYSIALNKELKEKGIVSTAVCPGWIKTNLYIRAKIGAKKATNKFAGIVSPNKVAKKALKDAFKNKDISVYGIHVKTEILLSKIMPHNFVIWAWLKQQGL